MIHYIPVTGIYLMKMNLLLENPFDDREEDELSPWVILNIPMDHNREGYIWSIRLSKWNRILEAINNEDISGIETRIMVDTHPEMESIPSILESMRDSLEYTIHENINRITGYSIEYIDPDTYIYVNGERKILYNTLKAFMIDKDAFLGRNPDKNILIKDDNLHYQQGHLIICRSVRRKYGTEYAILHGWNDSYGKSISTRDRDTSDTNVVSEYQPNLITLEKYTPVVVYAQDGGYLYSILDNDILVDNQSENLSMGNITDDNDEILDVYWNWSYPLIIRDSIYHSIVSEHGLDYMDNVHRIVESLIIPCPRDITRVENNRDHSRCIIRVGKGYPVISIPRSISRYGSIVVFFDEDLIHRYLQIRKSTSPSVYGVIVGNRILLYNQYRSIFSSVYGSMLIYIHVQVLNVYTLTPGLVRGSGRLPIPGYKPIQLYGDTISFRDAPLENLLEQLKDYRYIRTIPRLTPNTLLHDMDIK